MSLSRMPSRCCCPGCNFVRDVHQMLGCTRFSWSLVQIAFTVNLISWFYWRLYVYPFFVIYSSFVQSLIVVRRTVAQLVSVLSIIAGTVTHCSPPALHRASCEVCLMTRQQFLLARNSFSRSRGLDSHRCTFTQQQTYGACCIDQRTHTHRDDVRRMMYDACFCGGFSLFFRAC
jgi:hypothetical protein